MIVKLQLLLLNFKNNLYLIKSNFHLIFNLNVNILVNINFLHYFNVVIDLPQLIIIFKDNVTLSIRIINSELFLTHKLFKSVFSKIKKIIYWEENIRKKKITIWVAENWVIISRQKYKLKIKHYKLDFIDIWQIDFMWQKNFFINIFSSLSQALIHFVLKILLYANLEKVLIKIWNRQILKIF